MGQILQNLFNRCYTLLKLNLMFWLFSLIGGLVLGIGPSLLAMMSMKEDFDWDYKEMTLSAYFERFKVYFKKGNGLFYLYLMIVALVGYNLFLSVQVRGILFLIIDFILVFAIIFFSVTFMFTQVILVRYDIKFSNAIKLGMILFFMNFIDILKLLLGLLIIFFITYKSPALLLFGTFSGIQVYLIWRTQKMFINFETQYFGEESVECSDSEWL